MTADAAHEVAELKAELAETYRSVTVLTNELGIAEDILQQQFAKLERAENLLAQNVKQLARSNTELEHFATIASHDLQEPLRKVQAFGDRLKSKYEDVIDEQGQQYIASMQNASARMQLLIEGLLNYSRVTTKAQAFVPVDLIQTALDVVSDMEITIQKTDANIDIGELPTIDADPLQMRQLFQNLLSNALKYRREDTIPNVKVEARIVQNGLAGANGTSPRLCQITVADNGIGFDEKYSDRIFGIFERLHGKEKFEGTGVGLAVCRKISEVHGGHIEAKSCVGQGATFIVTLPMSHAKKEVIAEVIPEIRTGC